MKSTVLEKGVCVFSLLQCADEVLFFSICTWLELRHVRLNIFHVPSVFFYVHLLLLTSRLSLRNLDVHIYKAAGSKLH